MHGNVLLVEARGDRGLAKPSGPAVCRTSPPRKYEARIPAPTTRFFPRVFTVTWNSLAGIDREETGIFGADDWVNVTGKFLFFSGADFL